LIWILFIIKDTCSRQQIFVAAIDLTKHIDGGNRNVDVGRRVLVLFTGWQIFGITVDLFIKKLTAATEMLPSLTILVQCAARCWYRRYAVDTYIMTTLRDNRVLPSICNKLMVTTECLSSPPLWQHFYSHNRFARV
jgi:hypothetical protein